jgi:hypothetical protein
MHDSPWGYRPMTRPGARLLVAAVALLPSVKTADPPRRDPTLLPLHDLAHSAGIGCCRRIDCPHTLYRDFRCALYRTGAGSGRVKDRQSRFGQGKSERGKPPTPGINPLPLTVDRRGRRDPTARQHILHLFDGVG